MYKLHLVFNSFMMVTEVPIRGSCHIHIDLRAHWTGFYVTGTSIMKELIH